MKKLFCSATIAVATLFVASSALAQNDPFTEGAISGDINFINEIAEINEPVDDSGGIVGNFGQIDAETALDSPGFIGAPANVRSVIDGQAEYDGNSSIDGHYEMPDGTIVDLSSSATAHDLVYVRTVDDPTAEAGTSIEFINLFGSETVELPNGGLAHYESGLMNGSVAVRAGLTGNPDRAGADASGEYRGNLDTMFDTVTLSGAKIHTENHASIDLEANTGQHE